MYEKIRKALIENGCGEWEARMTAEKIIDAGFETVREVLNKLANE